MFENASKLAFTPNKEEDTKEDAKETDQNEKEGPRWDEEMNAADAAEQLLRERTRRQPQAHSAEGCTPESWSDIEDEAETWNAEFEPSREARHAKKSTR